MIRLETFGTVHTHTIHLENVWQVFAMPIATSHIITQTYAHKCAKIVENLIIKIALIDKKICKLRC